METPSAPPVYPTLASLTPVVPTTHEPSQIYRLELVHRLQRQLEVERDSQHTLCKKYHRGVDVIDALDTTLIALSTGLGIGGVGLLATIVAAPIVLGLEIGSAGCGILTVAGRCIGRRLATKARKHDKILVLANSKINTIASYVSKALNDGEITDLEFKLITGELGKYYTLKEEIRNSARTTSAEKKELLQRGRDEARRSFMRKIQGGN